ncbi:DUF4326 domain-containing protein [Amycolatopsis sp. NPDC051373]|uniref:DUF4326 domain-containing protein n=1 Tax=Amycolatopsis sp. NPDC051373 TaxID=3155801 RepID=UPI00344DF08C
MTSTGRRPWRLTRERVAGWQDPEGSVYVGPGSRWENPYRIDDYPQMRRGVYGEPERVSKPARRLQANRDFEAMLMYGLVPPSGVPYPSLREIRRELRGKDLVCTCAQDERHCHAGLLIDAANFWGE